MRACEKASWETLEKKVKDLREKFGESLVFRGQGNSAWPLKTTLETTWLREYVLSKRGL